MSKKFTRGIGPTRPSIGHPPAASKNETVRAAPPASFDAGMRIKAFFHCRQCLDELPEGVSPRDWAQLEVGSTEAGWQVWCRRHDSNVVHMWFEGMKHPAILGRHPKKGETN